MDIQAAVDADGTERVLARLTGIAKYGNRTMMQKVAKNWLARVHAEFITESDPYGLPWKELSAKAVEIKDGNTQRLYQTGALFASYGITAGPKRARIESSLPFVAERHNSGTGVASEPPHGPIPVRQIMPAPDDLPPSWTADVDNAFADMMIEVTA